MSDLIDRYQNLIKTGFEYAEQDKGNAPTSNFEIYMGHFASLSSEIHTALSEADQRVKDARREALENAAKVVDANMLCGADSEVLLPRSNPGNKVGLAYAAAIRALIPSEPHDAEGTSWQDPSIFDDAEGRN